MPQRMNRERKKREGMETTRETDGGLTAKARAGLNGARTIMCIYRLWSHQDRSKRRSKFETISRLYQATQYTLHKEYQG